jgi:hypothetical protein
VNTKTATPPPPPLTGVFRVAGADNTAATSLANDLIGLGLPLPEPVDHAFRVVGHVNDWRHDQSAKALEEFRAQWTADAIAAADALAEMPDPEPLALKVALAQASNDAKTDLDRVRQASYSKARSAAAAHRAEMLKTLIDAYTACVKELDDTMADLPRGVDSAEQAVRADCGLAWADATDLAGRYHRLIRARSELARRSGHDPQLSTLKYPKMLDLKALPPTGNVARRVHAILHSPAGSWLPTDAELLAHTAEVQNLTAAQTKAMANLDARVRA